MRYNSAGLTASFVSRLIGTLRSQVWRAFLIFSARVSSSLANKSDAASLLISRSKSLVVYGTASEFSNCFGFSPPRLKPDPIVALISGSFNPICFAAPCKSTIALSNNAGAKCACLPSVNAALLSTSLRPPRNACTTSPTTLSRTFSKYVSLICYTSVVCGALKI